MREALNRSRKILIFESPPALADCLLKKWVEIGREAVGCRGRFTVALSGGRSPMEFYCKLSALKDFDLWQRTHVFLGDERLVPPDDGDSNFRMIRENLLDYVNIPSENVHPLLAGQKNVDLAAEHYKNELAAFFELKKTDTPCFDLILLGVGTDGHVASLFPGDERIDDTARWVLPVSLPHLKNERVSLALPVINNARNVVVLALGAGKAGILKEIIEDRLEVPASKVNPGRGRLVYLLDKDAAQKLSYRHSCSHEDQAVSYECGT